MDVQRFKQADHARVALAYVALGAFTALRTNTAIPDYIRADAQRIEDRWNALSAEMDDAMGTKAVEAREAAIRG